MVLVVENLPIIAGDAQDKGSICQLQIGTCQEYTELYKKDLHDRDNHNGVITNLESDILECKVKWASGSITMNKASGVDGNPVELFQILKMML